MSNNYVPNESDLLPGELARSADINLRYSNLVAGFDLLPTPLGSGQTGFSAALNVGTPTADAHAVTKLYATTTIVTAAEAAALAYIQPTLAAHLAATTVLRDEAAASATASANSAAASQTSRIAAETAETNAETAETNAETAEAASVAAKNTSVSSASASATSAAQSSTSATEALASKNAAATSATNSAASAVTSNTAKTSALAAQAAAETAETNAEAAESNVVASASAASASAASALTSKNSATASATSATSSASSASGSSGTATTKANESAASATAALASKNSATTSATTATNQATISTTKAGESATSATGAATSASNASTSASNAATSETNAGSSASAAAGSASAAAASFEQFDDIYLGAKSSAPTVDNDGNALATGALYFNTVSNTMFVYSGSSWAAAGSAVNGTAERQEYTATSGQTTFNATYDVGFVDVYLNGSRLVPTTDFTASNGATVVLTTGATTGDNVGIIAYAAFSLASVYTKSQSDSRYFQIANNLSDLASAPTALTNLGLTATATELNYTDGVTSSIQTQLDNLDSLPSQTGNSGKLLTTNGTVAAWQASTGTGNVVLSTTPTLTTPILSGITTTASGSMEFAPANYTMVVRGGGSDEGSITLNCAANTHGQTITSQPHSANATNTMLLPEGADSTLVSRVSTDTLTNKTLTAPVLTAPALGTPASGVMTSVTGLPLTTGVTGTLGVANGGTGATSLAANNVILGNGASAPQLVAPSTAGNILTSDGTTWASTAPAGGAAGMTLVGTASGTGVNYMSLPNVFSSTYDEYAIVFSGELTGNGRLDYQFYKSGAYVTWNAYDLKCMYLASTTMNFMSFSSQTWGILHYSANVGNAGYRGTIIHVNSSDSTRVPTIFGKGFCRNFISQNSSKLDHESYRGPVTGIRIANQQGSNTFTGTVKIYGLLK